jgi:hypothetical protein
VLFEDVGDRVACDPMTEIGQRSANAGIAPVAVLGGHANDQVLDLFHHDGSSETSSLAAVVLASNQRSMPTQ